MAYRDPEKHKAWRERNRERLNAYKRQWSRDARRSGKIVPNRARAIAHKAYAFETAAFTLHSLPCGYPEEGCSCRAIVVAA